MIKVIPCSQECFQGCGGSYWGFQRTVLEIFQEFCGSYWEFSLVWWKFFEVLKTVLEFIGVFKAVVEVIVIF